MLIVVKLCEVVNRHGRSGLPEMKIPYPVTQIILGYLAKESAVSLDYSHPRLTDIV